MSQRTTQKSMVLKQYIASKEISKTKATVTGGFFICSVT